ncbi:hypothetical protein B0H34DRAFT_678956 [Crassisporium funariophilum]|nr:hypothetical protein B0H34DRAFT_678956 [Crassisporium funariophilum]
MRIGFIFMPNKDRASLLARQERLWSQYHEQNCLVHYWTAANFNVIQAYWQKHQESSYWTLGVLWNWHKCLNYTQENIDVIQYHSSTSHEDLEDLGLSCSDDYTLSGCSVPNTEDGSDNDNDEDMANLIQPQSSSSSGRPGSVSVKITKPQVQF